MVSLDHARKILGKRAEPLSDSELQNLLENLYILAEVMIDVVEESGSKKQRGVIDSIGRDHDNGN